MANYLVIAASSSIGQALVEKLKNDGHQVFQTARTDAKITPDFYLDATDFLAVEEVFRQVGEIDGVVNCSGSLLLKSAHLTSQDEYKSVIANSLDTAFATVRAAGKYMRKGGSVVLISSAAAMTGLANHEAIAAAKAGIIGLTMSAAASYASQNLRFNAVAPGLTATNLTKIITENEKSLSVSQAMHALGRIGSAAEVANAVAFFLDPQNSWITGQVLGVDGGLGSVRPKVKA
ncbi:MAG: SDR family oxidoreductase [Proteobacteria bacterium]|nr:SDR family oxidoreductase [Pseudomonadota bacterium]